MTRQSFYQIVYTFSDGRREVGRTFSTIAAARRFARFVTYATATIYRGGVGGEPVK